MLVTIIVPMAVLRRKFSLFLITAGHVIFGFSMANEVERCLLIISIILVRYICLRVLYCTEMKNIIAACAK